MAYHDTIMFPKQPDLSEQKPPELDIGKLYNGSIVTDTCDQGWKQRRLLALAAKNSGQTVGKVDDELVSLK